MRLSTTVGRSGQIRPQAAVGLSLAHALAQLPVGREFLDAGAADREDVTALERQAQGRGNPR